jgi:hypothetical protein
MKRKYPVGELRKINKNFVDKIQVFKNIEQKDKKFKN